MNLLIVEDEQFFRDYLRLRVATTAQKEAPNIFEAATLHDALAILSRERIDAVLSDGAFSPDWGEGMEDICEWARSSERLHQACKAHRVPCVLLTGDPVILESARGCGQAAYSKPYETRAAIERLVALASAHLLTGAR